MLGDPTLFTRTDAVDRLEVHHAILDAWDNPTRPLPYPAGSWGPEAADRLMEGTETEWRRL